MFLKKINWIIFGCLLLTAAAFSSSVFVNAHPAEDVVKTPSSSAIERRCGWFQNPGPGNAWFYDKDGEWIIGEQGGHQAKGDWPAFTPKQWVSSGNASYGYGCACLQVSVNHETKQVLEIKSSTVRPLSVCRKDKSLKKMTD